jgi:hypothetical protein
MRRGKVFFQINFVARSNRRSFLSFGIVYVYVFSSKNRFPQALVSVLAMQASSPEFGAVATRVISRDIFEIG